MLQLILELGKLLDDFLSFFSLGPVYTIRDSTVYVVDSTSLVKKDEPALVTCNAKRAHQDYRPPISRRDIGKGRLVAGAVRS